MLYVRNFFDALLGTRARATTTLVIVAVAILAANAAGVSAAIEVAIQVASRLADALGRGIMLAVVNLGIPLLLLAMLWGYVKSKFK